MILQVGGWIAYGVVMYLWGLSYWNPRDAFVNKSLLVSTGLLASLGLRLIYRMLRQRSVNPPLSAVIIGVASFSSAALWRESQSVLFNAYLTVVNKGTLLLRCVRIPLGTFLYDGFVLLAWSLLYHLIQGWLDLSREKERRHLAELSARSARLRALQSQLEPHFIFNALNGISTLVAEGQARAATRMIARLSEFLRLTLVTLSAPEISVEQELTFVRLYLEIEQARFGNRLQVAINAQPECLSGQVPSLILQPLVENAIRHGVLPRESGGSVAVSVTRSDKTLQLTVQDDGVGMATGVTPGIGLSNTDARLSELYGEQATFSLSTSSGRGVLATIRVPYRIHPRHESKLTE
jgi:two-component system sensor histidine kinase AlgZ